MVELRQNMQQQQAAIDAQKREVETASARVRQAEASNWLETTRVRTQQMEAENVAAVIRRDKASIEQRENQLRLQEDQRRRNRYISAFQVASCRLLTRTGVARYLQHSSKIRLLY